LLNLLISFDNILEVFLFNNFLHSLIILIAIKLLLSILYSFLWSWVIVSKFCIRLSKFMNFKSLYLHETIRPNIHWIILLICFRFLSTLWLPSFVILWHLIDFLKVTTKRAMRSNPIMLWWKEWVRFFCCLLILNFQVCISSGMDSWFRLKFLITVSIKINFLSAFCFLMIYCHKWTILLSFIRFSKIFVWIILLNMTFTFLFNIVNLKIL